MSTFTIGIVGHRIKYSETLQFSADAQFVECDVMFFGVVVTSALAAQGIDKLSIPAAQIVGLVIFGALAGLIAAILPARRAAKLNILEAIAYE